MTKYTTVLGNLLSPLSRSDFQSAVNAYEGDKRTKRFTTYDLFKSMIYGQLTGCISVREIGNSQRANNRQLYHAGLKPIKRSTFCDAMEKRDYRIFQDVFAAVTETAHRISGSRNNQFKNPLKIIDASTIPLCLEKCDWAVFRQKKGAVKLHLSLDGDTLIPDDAFLSLGSLHDVNGMPHLCTESGVSYVFDRAYVDYKSLYDIHLSNSFFVTRMKKNGAYRRIKNNQRDKDSPICSDVLIELTGAQTKKKYPKPLRKIRYHDKTTRRTYEFITNDLERDAQQVADIYKQRWQIELFFKWIKQNLKIKTFWGTSQNAVYTQIWVALILSVLLWIRRTLDGISVSAHELIQMMKTTLLSRNSLAGFCFDTPPPDVCLSDQLVFQGLF